MPLASPIEPPRQREPYYLYFALIESFPAQVDEIADVSLIEGTTAGCNYSFFFVSPRNGIEEADGSIPFSSTKALRNFFSRG